MQRDLQLINFPTCSRPLVRSFVFCFGALLNTLTFSGNLPSSPRRFSAKVTTKWKFLRRNCHWSVEVLTKMTYCCQFTIHSIFSPRSEYEFERTPVVTASNLYSSLRTYLGSIVLARETAKWHDIKRYHTSTTVFHLPALCRLYWFTGVHRGQMSEDSEWEESYPSYLSGTFIKWTPLADRCPRSTTYGIALLQSCGYHTSWDIGCAFV